MHYFQVLKVNAFHRNTVVYLRVYCILCQKAWYWITFCENEYSKSYGCYGFQELLELVLWMVEHMSVFF